MQALNQIFDRARTLRRHIILPEGADQRVSAAAAIAAREGFADITLMNGDATGVRTLDARAAGDLGELAAAYHSLRANKGVTYEQAVTAMLDPIAQAAMRIRLGQAHGTVGGAVATTADTVRAALQIIGKASRAQIVSSFFLMMPKKDHASISHGMIFSDCGLVISPNTEELADIALAAAESCRELLGAPPLGWQCYLSRPQVLPSIRVWCACGPHWHLFAPKHLHLKSKEKCSSMLRSTVPSALAKCPPAD